MKPEDFVDDTKETVDPYILEDVDWATRAPYEVWVEAVLGLPQERLQEWVQHIAENEWYKDEIIQMGMNKFIVATEETERYQPFVDIANRILELGKVQLSGEGAYPLDDITIVRNDPTYLNRISEHSGLGAKRKPDLLAVRGKKVQLLEEVDDKAFDWSDVLLFIEMKYWNQNLFHNLQAWRSQRGLPKLDRRTLLPVDSPEEVKVASTEEPDAVPSRTIRTGSSMMSATAAELHCSFTSDYIESEAVDIDDSGNYKKLRRNDESIRAVAKFQAGGYALETVACSYGTRLFTTGLVMQDDKTSLWYYDACGVIRTKESLSLFDDFEQIAAILVAFACCEPSQWGSLPPNIVKPPRSSPYPESFPSNNLKGYTLEMTLSEGGNKVHVTLQDPIFTRYSLVGRRTFLYAIKTNSRKLRKPMVAKFSYQATTRKREQDFIEVAREAGVGHLPEIHMWGDFWNMSEGVRAIFFKRCGPDHEYEDRVFRGIVYSQYFPLKDLFSKSCELIPTMVYQMLDCLHDLRYKAKILHRDISANNVMWEMHGEEVVFKLIDFDFATFVDGDGRPIATTSSSKHRTGTLAFMAYELVCEMADRNDPPGKPAIHMLCHEFESLYYLSVYSMITMPEVEDTVRRKLYRQTVWLWENGLMEQIAACKARLWDSLYIERLPIPSQCEPLRPWLLLFSDIIQEARTQLRSHRKKTSEPFDQETMGGVLTRDVIKNTLMGGVDSEFVYFSTNKSSVSPEASGSLNLAMAEEETTLTTKAKKAAPARKAPVKHDAAKGKKAATAKVVTPKKIGAAKASKTKDVTSKAKLAVTSETETMRALTRRGPMTRSMTKRF
ncbi:hypothetical protein EW026_g5264 [Hermanssonia centrifuga]|uniref:Protein kinase domain-containing protein n=1 Tax=Hermanssonia centrifuga TaxID=98765 RepID=A0A4S4KGE1_9APHY|nr:hypothetical protein EW026_g5264 [Hermanssonia centrifuga]